VKANACCTFSQCVHHAAGRARGRRGNGQHRRGSVFVQVSVEDLAAKAATLYRGARRLLQPGGARRNPSKHLRTWIVTRSHGALSTIQSVLRCRRRRRR